MSAVTIFTNCHIYRVEFPSGRTVYASTLQLAWDDAAHLEPMRGKVFLHIDDSLIWSPGGPAPDGVDSRRSRIM